MEPKPGLGNFNFLDFYKNQMPKRDDFMSIGGPGGGELLRGGETPPGYKEPINRIGNYNLEQIKFTPDDFMSIGGPGGGQADPLSPIYSPSPGLMPTKPDMLPNLATGVMEPVGQPMPQLPQGPQPIPQVPSPIMPPMREIPSEPMPMENIIRANDPAIMPMPAKMPMSPEPMPMPSPMPIRPRMPMPGPIATPMPMAPTNLQLPQIETQMPMMSLDRGIGSFKTLV